MNIKMDLKRYKGYLTRKNAIVALIAVFVILIFIYVSLPKDCGSDKTCFDKAAEKCSKVTLNTVSSGNNYLYEIRGSVGKDCIVNIKMLKISASPKIAEKLENKAMLCKIPKEELSTSSLEDIQKVMDNCTGPLKEGMLQLLIEKMYSLIVKNMGKIVIDLEDALKPAA